MSVTLDIQGHKKTIFPSLLAEAWSRPSLLALLALPSLSRPSLLAEASLWVDSPRNLCRVFSLHHSYQQSQSWHLNFLVRHFFSFFKPLKTFYSSLVFFLRTCARKNNVNKTYPSFVPIQCLHSQSFRKFDKG